MARGKTEGHTDTASKLAYMLRLYTAANEQTMASVAAEIGLTPVRLAQLVSGYTDGTEEQMKLIYAWLAKPRV